MIRIPEPELESPGISLGDHPFLETLAGKADDHARGDGVQTVSVADLIAFGDGLEVDDIKVAPQGGDRLIFRPAIARVDAVLGIVQGNAALAPDGTDITPPPLLQKHLIVKIPSQRPRVIEFAPPKIVDGQSASLGQDFREDRCPIDNSVFPCGLSLKVLA